MFASCRPLGALALLSLIAIQFAAAQVTTDCQPLDGACPPDPAFGMDHMFHFNATPSQDVWEEKVRGVKYDREQGAIFTINQQGDAPTLRSKFYFFWGRTELIMKAAPGKGIVSSMMWLSDDLDEVDWEFLGMNTSMAASNYFSKGVEDFTKGKYHVQPFNNQDDYHNYTCIWTKDRLDWLIDGNLVRTLLAKDANDTLTYPQTPMRLSLGIWAGGDPRMPENTRQWAGGDTDYGAGPYTMYVKSVRVTDFTQNAKQYEYGDRSGSWESIKIVEGNSTVKDVINAPPPETFNDKWNKLAPTAKIAIYASAAGLGAAIIAFGLFYCIRQRRRGAREARIAEAKSEADRRERDDMKARGINPDSFTSHGQEYDAVAMRKEGLVQTNSYSVPSTPGDDTPGLRTKESAWEMGAVSSRTGMHSPVPLLQDVQPVPRVASPGSGRPYSPAMGPGVGAGMYSDRTRSPAPPSPMRGPTAPGMGPGMGAGMYSDRTRSPAPLSPMRGPAAPGMPPRFPLPASPQHRSASSPNTYMRTASPAHQEGFRAPRMNSPAMMHPPRSVSSPRTNQGYPAPSGGYGNDGYWNNGGYR